MKSAQSWIELDPWVTDFSARERKIWAEKRGQADVLSAPDRAEMMATTSTIGGDIVKVKPELKPLWDLLASAGSIVFETSIVAHADSLKGLPSAVRFDRHPFDRTVRWGTVANVRSNGLVVGECFQCSAEKS